MLSLGAMVKCSRSWPKGRKHGRRTQGSCFFHESADLFLPNNPLEGDWSNKTQTPVCMRQSGEVTLPIPTGSLTELGDVVDSLSAQKRKTDFWSEVTAEVVGVSFM